MKTIKKYFGLFILAGLIFMIATPTVSAQNRQRRETCKFLTEKQQDQVKEIRAKYQKDLTHYNNKLNELRAKQRTLIQTDKPNLKSLYANTEAKTELQKKMAKTRTKMHIEIRNLMTEDQRLMMNSRMGKRGMMHKGMHQRMGQCGKGQGRQHMQQGNRRGDCQGNNQGVQRRMNRQGDYVNCYNKSQRRMHRQGECGNCNKEGRRGMYKKGDRRHCQGNGNYRGHQNRCNANGQCAVNLTEEQEEAFKNLRIEKLKTVNPLKNKLNELRAKKHSLMSAEKINNKEIDKIIDSMSDIKEKIGKANIKQRVEMRKLLTEEQKVMFDRHHNRPYKRNHGKF